MRHGTFAHPAAGLALLMFAFCLAPAAPIQAGAVGVPVSLSVDPASVKQGDDAQSILKIVVTLEAPSPEYFICEVRSDDRSKISCSDIIFKKGDLSGVGLATVNWSQIDADCRVKITARNVETPDVIVSYTVNLQVRTNE
jgi:hypothetical protein